MSCLFFFVCSIFCNKTFLKNILDHLWLIYLKRKPWNQYKVTPNCSSWTWTVSDVGLNYVLQWILLLLGLFSSFPDILTHFPSYICHLSFNLLIISFSQYPLFYLVSFIWLQSFPIKSFCSLLHLQTPNTQTLQCPEAVFSSPTHPWFSRMARPDTVLLCCVVLWGCCVNRTKRAASLTESWAPGSGWSLTCMKGFKTFADLGRWPFCSLG